MRDEGCRVYGSLNVPLTKSMLITPSLSFEAGEAYLETGVVVMVVLVVAVVVVMTVVVVVLVAVVVAVAVAVAAVVVQPRP